MSFAHAKGCGGKMYGTSPPTAVISDVAIRDRITKRLYTVPELMRLTGLTRKQIAYWARIDLVVPTLRDPDAVPGQPASFYAAANLVKALIACELRRRGFTLRQVQQVARNLREDDMHWYRPEAYLLTDGYTVYYAFSDGEVVDVLKHRRQMLLIPIHEQVARLREVA